MTDRNPFSTLCLFNGDGMCPRITKAKSRGLFLSGKFGGGFDDGSQWVAVNPRVLTVGVVDAPKLRSR